MKYSTAVRNSRNDAMQAAIGFAPTLEIWAGAVPQSCEDKETGQLIASGVLPQDWMTQAVDGKKSRLGVWKLHGLPAAGMGAAGEYYRIKQGGVCHMQGSFGKGKDMAVDNNRIAYGQVVLIERYDITEGNA